MYLPINRLQHIGLPVTDVQRSAAFYERLGFTTAMSTQFDYGGGKGTVMMLQREAILLELYQLPEPELTQVRARRDGHIDHIAFDVSDIDAVFATLKEANFAIQEEAPVFLPFWSNGCRYFNVLGPDGERLEFNQIL